MFQQRKYVSKFYIDGCVEQTHFSALTFFIQQNTIVLLCIDRPNMEFIIKYLWNQIRLVRNLTDILAFFQTAKCSPVLNSLSTKKYRTFPRILNDIPVSQLNK